MKKILSAIMATALAATLLTGCSAPAPATTTGASVTPPVESKYPEKQITLVVQSNPGGLSDQISRNIAMGMEKELGKPVVCVYKPGGTGAVGMSYVEASNPDGYTIGHTPVELTMIQALGFANLDPENFTLLGRAYTTSGALAIKFDETKYTNLDEFVEYAKAHPGEIKVGNAGVGSLWHLGALGFAQAAGIEFNHVPFDGAAKSVAALMGGHIDAVVCAPIELVSGIDAKKIKMIATMGEEKAEAYPDVPTLKEKNIDFSLLHWGGFAAPKGMEPDVEKALVNALKIAVENPEYQAFLKERGMEPNFLAGEEYKTFVSEQFAYYTTLIPEAGIK